MISVQDILDLQNSKVEDWHVNFHLTRDSLPWKFIEENHQWNFSLWHEEDIARIKDIDPLRIMQAKRNIDVFNQARNNAMEKIDEWILNYLEFNNIVSKGDLHSETPGMMIDRLSIMSLKRFHMNEETLRSDASTEHKANCRGKVLILDEQIRDLSICLENIISKLQTSEISFKVYRQMKMYNDPSLNPQLYKRASNTS
jgi:Protein of unknown function (DUF4254)